MEESSVLTFHRKLHDKHRIQYKLTKVAQVPPKLQITHCSRGAKRQTAHSTVKGLGNFLVLEPRQFCSDFLFEPNYIGICCYLESNIPESIF